jgi:hypothetical protein
VVNVGPSIKRLVMDKSAPSIIQIMPCVLGSGILEL